jgi:hypothetical protein
LLSLINVIHRRVKVGEGKAAPGNGGVKVQHHAFFWFRLILNKLHGVEFFLGGGGGGEEEEVVEKKKKVEEEK